MCRSTVGSLVPCFCFGLGALSFRGTFPETIVPEFERENAHAVRHAFHKDGSMTMTSDTTATLTFGLYPGRNLRCSLHTGISESTCRALAERALNYDAADDKSATSFGRYAIMDADRVVSLQHIAVAGNIALARYARWEAQDVNATNNGNNNRRGIGQETVVCAAGTSHSGYALRDTGFFDVAPASEPEKQKQMQQDAKASASSFTIVVIGFDCEGDAEYEKFLADMGLDDEGRLNMQQYFVRPRSKQELTGLLKAFKVSQNEVDMDGSSLEHAIITRIATKFVV